MESASSHFEDKVRWRPLEIAFWLCTLLPFVVTPDYLSLASQIAITALFALSPHLVSYAAECKQYASDASIAIGLLACALERGVQVGGVAQGNADRVLAGFDAEVGNPPIAQHGARGAASERGRRDSPR